MQRYFLHVQNGIGRTVDEEGQDFTDLEDAERRACEGVRSILSNEILEGTLDLNGYIEIATADGTVLRKILFSDVITVNKARDTE